MHPGAMALMQQHLGRVHWVAADCLDVGSRDVNGSYRALVEDRGWTYTGLDIVAGPNVDIVTPDPLHYPYPDGSFDVVISGSTMEHVTAIWLWIPELVRLLRPGGLLVVVAPHEFGEHRYPVDCWRVLPAGMRYLFEMTGLLEGCAFDKGQKDTVGSGFKVSGDG